MTLFRKLLIGLSLLACAFTNQAADDSNPGLFTHTVNTPLNSAYDALYAELEKNKFWVVFEANLGQRMQGMQKRWGKDYNRSQLEGARTMVFCSIDWAHTMANADPDALALCPLRIALYARDGKTHITMARPSHMLAATAAAKPAKKLEDKLITIIRSAAP